MPSKLSIDIAVLLKGAEQINKLADSLNRLKGASTGVNKSGVSGRGGGASKAADANAASAKAAAREIEQQEKATLALASAEARLLESQGKIGSAVTRLKSALAQVNQETIAAVRTRTQLVGVESRAATAAGKAETAMLAEARAIARLQQIAGDTPAAIKTLGDALAKVTNPNSLAAIRAELQKTYLDTNYANSPLIGAIRSVSQGLTFLSPLLGRTGGALTSIVGVAGRAAEGFINTAKAEDAAAKGASKFSELLNGARNAAQRFATDQGGSASLTDFLLNLSKLAANAGDRIRAAFARIREAVTSAFANLRQGKSPIASLFPTTNTSAITAGLANVANTAKVTGQSIAGISPAAVGATAALGGLVVAGLSLAGVVVVGKQLVDVLIEIGQVGIAANSGFEQTKLGIASVVASVGKLNQNGVELKGVDALNAALPIAQKQLDALRVDALNTALTFEQISKGFLQAVGPGLAAGLNLDQIRKTVIDLSQLIGPLTGQTEQLGQELRAIFSGDINQDTQVAKALQITREQVKAAKEAGTFAEFLNEKLKIASVTGALMAQTFEAAKSNLQEAGTVLAAQVSEGLFTSLRTKVNELLPQIFTTAGGKVNIAPAFAGIADTLTEIFDRVGLAAERVIVFIIDGVKQISKFLGDNQPTIDQIFESVETIAEQLVGIVSDLFKSVGLTGDFSSGLSTVSTVLKAVAVALAGIRETMFLIRSAVITVGSAIGFALIQPLRAAVNAIAAILSFVPGLSGVAQGVAKVLNDASASLASAVKNNGAAVADTVRNFGKAGREALLDIANAPLAAKFKREARGFSKSLTGINATLSPPDKAKDKAKAQSNADAKAAIASESRLQDARLALAKAFSDREIELSKSGAELQTRILEQQLDDRQISLENFFAEKAKLIAEDSARERQAIQDQISAQRQRITEITGKEQSQLKIAKSPAERTKVSNDAEAERVKILAQIVDLETKLNVEETKGAAQTEVNARKRLSALRELRGEIESVETQLLEATGRGFEAAALDIDNRFRDLITRAILEFGESSPQVAAIEALKAALKTDATIRQIEREGSARQAEFDIARVDVQTQLEKGLFGEIEARKRILAIQKAFAEVERARLDQQIAAQKQLTGAASPEVLKLEVQRKQLDTLGVDPIFAQIRSGLESDLSGAFSDFIANAKFNLEGLKNFATGVLDSFRKAIAKVLSDRIEKSIIAPISNAFLDKVLGIKTIDPAQLANTVSTDANTAAIIANTAAQTAGATQGLIGDFAVPQVDGIGNLVGNASKTASSAAEQGKKAANAVTGNGGALASFFGNIKGAFEKFANGLKSVATGVGSAIKSVLSSIIGAIGSVLGSIGLGGKGAAPAGGGGFAEGGATGGSNPTRPAGVVHEMEFVEPAHIVKRWGPQFFEAIRQGRLTPQNLLAGASNYLSGLSNISVRARSGSFASGGLAGLAPVAAAPAPSSGQSLRIVNVNEPDQAADFLSSAAGEQVILNRISKSPAKWRAALKV